MDPIHGNLLHRVTIGDLLARAAARLPAKTALIDGDRIIDYQTLNARAAQAANAFAGLGVKRGDRVAFICRNATTSIAARFGLAKIGAIAVPVNLMLRPDDVAGILADAAPSVIVADADLRALAGSANTQARHFQIGPGADWPNLDALIDDAPSSEPQAIVNSDDVATLIYTTGTEATPKGVMLSHLNHVMGLMHLMADCGFNRREVIIIDLPPFHIAGTALLFAALLLGGTAVVLPAPDPTQVLALTERHRVTRWSYPPTLFAGLLTHPLLDRVDLSSLKTCIVFGGAVSDKVRAAWDARCPGLDWHNYWGQSESTAVGTTSWEDQPAAAGNAIGRPDFGVSIRIADDNDTEVEPGRVGELLIRGPAVMRGYWNRPDLTRTTLRVGWLHTGDLGFVGASGEFHFVDRKKEMIKTGGENVSAAEVEAVLTSHPLVMQAAVVGLPDPRWTEAVTACVVPVPGERPAPDEIVSFCKQRLAGFKVPKAVYVWSALPLSPAGKVMKRLLKDELLATGSQEVST
jgi:fatty-acyl-CoA synthase